MSRGLLVASIVLAATAARAQGQICGEIPRVLIVLDRSGSMTELVNGNTKWSIAKQAVTTLDKQFSGQLAMGLLLYPRWPIATACSTGMVNVAPKVNNSGPIQAALGGAYPAGNTPIAATLDEAHAYLAKLGSKLPYVILVSDGKETCLLPKAAKQGTGSCSWENGTNYRKCGGCGWQFCLKSGTWSSVCQAKPEIFTCPGGQTCGGDATCSGTITGSLDAAQAAARLSKLGVRTYVVGFGAQVDGKSLDAVASAGGTGSYYKAGNLTQLVAAFKQIAAAISCCGNGAIDAGEQCDTKIAPGQVGACPTQCDDKDPCTKDTLVGKACGVSCKSTPIKSFTPGDGCCPTGATSLTDSDCPASCGNGVLDPGETCDPKIASGKQGACDLGCDDGDPCTRDAPGGSACKPSCFNTKLAADPTAKDGCCPSSTMTRSEDADCLPPCGPNLKVKCVDLCQNVPCGDGEYCSYGKCLPWPTGVDAAGCDCRVGQGAAGQGGAAGPAALAAALLLLLLALVQLRRFRNSK
jgi:hypothetical protein